MNQPATAQPTGPIAGESPVTDRLAAFLKAAGDPLRLDVLRVLRDNSFGVLELCEILDMRQSGMSHHLKVLAQAELVTTRREGNSIFYRRRLPEADELQGGVHAALLETLDRQPLDADIRHRLDTVHGRRAEQSHAFFTRNAERFDEQQDLIADYHQYGDLVRELLDRALPDGGERAVEIGPGAGEFLTVLARRFATVTGVDNSEAMLARARRHVADHKLQNVELMLGECGEAVARQLNADCVVMNMVLHHVPAPAELFQQVAALLKPEGRFVLTELSSHDQAWARESCGDLWLGFDERDLNQWAATAGLTPLESQFVGLRNGFQIQVRSFGKTRP